MQGDLDLKPIVCGSPIRHVVLILFVSSLRGQETAPPPPAPSPAPRTEATPTAAPAYEISGSARSGKTPLPGATVTAANTLTGKKYAAATNSEGKFGLSALQPRRYVV